MHSMRFPIRDVIPSRSRPIAAWSALTLLTALQLAQTPGWLILCVTLIHALPLLVLAEAVEDQLGHGRYLGLLFVTAAGGAQLADSSSAMLPTVTASTLGAHLALFPTARILLTLGVAVVEIPSFFLVGCWAFALVLLGGPLDGPALGLVASAAGARLLRLPGRSRWTHFDHTG